MSCCRGFRWSALRTSAGMVVCHLSVSVDLITGPSPFHFRCVRCGPPVLVAAVHAIVRIWIERCAAAGAMTAFSSPTTRTNETPELQDASGRRVEFKHSLRCVMAPGWRRYSCRPLVYPDVLDADETLMVVRFFQESRTLPKFLTDGATVSNQALCSTQLLLDCSCRTSIATLHLYANYPIYPVVTGDEYEIGALALSLAVAENTFRRRKCIRSQAEMHPL